MTETPSPAGWYPTDAGVRYWDGREWSAPPVLSDTERKKILAAAVAQHASAGSRVENQSDFQAVVVSGKPVNHVLHLILTIVTCSMWGIVWALIAAFGGEKRQVLIVDEQGQLRGA